MPDPKGDKLFVNLGSAEARRRLKGFGHGVRKVQSAGRNQAFIIHTATGSHLRELESKFADVGFSNKERPLGEPIENPPGRPAMIGREHFESAYQATAPWDIPGPQPAFVELEEAGAIQGSVLDAGCGTGEHALYLASKGHEVWGIDFVPLAIERAKAKANERRSSAHFQVADALELEKLGRQFDTVIDSGLFHTFGDDQRPSFVAGLAKVVRPGGRYHMMCFSDREPGTEGPRRVAQQEIYDAFRDGWTVEQIRESKFETVNYPGGPQFSPGGPKAWLASLARH